MIERLLAERSLERVTGAKADGQGLLQRASRTLATAASIVDRDPGSAYVLAYDAARLASTALLAQQGLRPTTSGGHYAVDEATRAQFGNFFTSFGNLRRRRNELEYSAQPADDADAQEAADAVAITREIIDAAEKLMPNLTLVQD